MTAATVALADARRIAVSPSPFADFYRAGVRLIITEAGEFFGGLLSPSGYESLLSDWTDETMPRTERPMRFGYRWHVGGISGNGTCWVRLNRCDVPTGWRVGYRG